MASVSPSSLLLFFFALLSPSLPLTSAAVFREYIGAQFKNVKFSDVPINPDVDFHFILAFAMDYTSVSNHTSTNGIFKPFWDTYNLSPSEVAAIKRTHSNVKVFLSLGGDNIGGRDVFFNPSSESSWVRNAVSSLTKIIEQYHLDGIDIDYEHFKGDPNIFAWCIGELVLRLKINRVVSLASIAPFEDAQVQSHYQALWKRNGVWIDYVNFQFYAYSARTSMAQFLMYFEVQSSNYPRGKVLMSFSTDSCGGLSNAFYSACAHLKSEGKLHGIFAWSADYSLTSNNAFSYEMQAQSLLARVTPEIEQSTGHSSE